MRSRLILNGKTAGRPEVREAIQQVRQSGTDLEVRVTFEAGDAPRMAQEACQDGVSRVIAGGGDGSVNEVLHGLLTAQASPTPILGILPLGTANDFATSCGIPKDLTAALQLAVSASPVPVDVGRANDRYFMNVASGGFGAAVTASTPREVKRLLGEVTRPVITYGKNYNGTIITEHMRKPGFEQPNLYWKPSIAVCGLDFYRGGLFPKWNNRLLVGALKYEEVRLLDIQDDRVVHQQVILKNAGRVRDVACGPDGAIYVVLNKPDIILRLSPKA